MASVALAAEQFPALTIDPVPLRARGQSFILVSAQRLNSSHPGEWGRVELPLAEKCASYLVLGPSQRVGSHPLQLLTAAGRDVPLTSPMHRHAIIAIY